MTKIFTKPIQNLPDADIPARAIKAYLSQLDNCHAGYPGYLDGTGLKKIEFYKNPGKHDADDLS